MADSKKTSKKTSKKKVVAKKKAAVTKKAAVKKSPVSKKPVAKKAVSKKKVSKKKVVTKPSIKWRITHEQRWQMISEAAYLLAEARGFIPGGEVGDWVTAEQQVDAMLEKDGVKYLD